MKLSRKAHSVEPAATLAITMKAKEMIRSGEDIILMSQGEPDFTTPKNICDAAVRAMNKGFTSYTPTPGVPELRQAIADKFKRENGLDYKPTQVMATNGGKHAIYTAFEALLDPGDEVILPAPCWVAYPQEAEMHGGTARMFKPASGGLKITPEDLENAIGPKTKIFAFNTPCNPSGAMYTKEELEALGDVCIRHGLWILSDEMYEKIVYDGNEHISIASLSKDLYRNTLTINGVSKSYAMTGWRIGYVGATEEVISAMSRLQSQHFSCLCSIAQYATVEALNGPQDSVAAMVAEFSKRRDYIVGRLNAINGVKCEIPGGAFYAFPDVSEFYGKNAGSRLIKGSWDLANYLLEEYKVAIVPGAPFFSDRYVRFSFACSMKDIERAMDRVEEAFTRIS